MADYNSLFDCLGELSLPKFGKINVSMHPCEMHREKKYYCVVHYVCCDKQVFDIRTLDMADILEEGFRPFRLLPYMKE